MTVSSARALALPEWEPEDAPDPGPGPDPTPGSPSLDFSDAANSMYFPVVF